MDCSDPLLRAFQYSFEGQIKLARYAIQDFAIDRGSGINVLSFQLAHNLAQQAMVPIYAQISIDGQLIQLMAETKGVSLQIGDKIHVLDFYVMNTHDNHLPSIVLSTTWMPTHEDMR